MHRKVETASSYARKVSISNTSPDAKLHYTITAMTYYTRFAFDVASEAVQLVDLGLNRHPAERALLIELKEYLPRCASAPRR